MARSRNAERPAGMIDATALVVQCEAPPQGVFGLLSARNNFIRVVVDAGSGPRMVTLTFSPSEDRWLVPGQDIPVWVPPQQPDSLLINWDAIPGMRERAAAGDPSLVDAVTGMRRVAAGMGRAPADGDWDRTPNEQRRQKVREFLHATPPPTGFVRAHVFIVTKRPKSRSDHNDPEGSNILSTEVTSETVLSVHPVGRPAYALFVPKFKLPKGQRTIGGTGYSALVPENDPADVRMQWEDVRNLLGNTPVDALLQGASRQSLVGGLRQANELRRALQQAQMQRAAMQQAQMQQWAAQQQAAQQQAAPQRIPQQQPGVAPPPGGVAWTPESRRAAILKLRYSLSLVPDPAQRQHLIEQYRAWGIHPTDEELNGPMS